MNHAVVSSRLIMSYLLALQKNFIDNEKPKNTCQLAYFLNWINLIVVSCRWPICQKKGLCLSPTNRFSSTFQR